MDLAELEKEATEELEIEKRNLAKDVLKSRIREIGKTEKLLKRLKDQYQSILIKSIDDVVDEAENGNIRF